MPTSDCWRTSVLCVVAAIVGAAPLAAQSAWPRWAPPVMSAVVPGSGQLVRGAVPRGLVYLGVEAGLLTAHVLSVDAGRDARDRYRTIAFTVARSPFQPVSVDTAFQYYEAMSKYVRSGPFDTDPGPTLVPPTDVTSFNGHIWELARQTFFPDPASPPAVDSPAYQQALAFYRRRAVGPAFEWSWQGQDAGFAEFREELERSDEAFRRATTLVGVVLLNHLVSAIDAVVSARVGSEEVGVRSELAVDPLRVGETTWRLGLRVAF